MLISTNIDIKHQYGLEVVKTRYLIYTFFNVYD